MPVQLIVCGAAGRMGRRIVALASEQPDVGVVAALEAPGSEWVGRDSGELAGIDKNGIAISDDYAAAAQAGTVTVDFTAPEASMKHLEAAARSGAAIIVGTSGLSHEQRGHLSKLAKNMPTMLAANMSIGVNVLLGLVEQAAAQLADFDCEIVEIHHNRKVDAPSGTAIALGETAAAARGLDPKSALLNAREGAVGARSKDEIGVVALRGGDAPGEHTVMLAGTGERIELTHRALSRDCLAAGAIRAARWLSGRAPGLYSMRDTLA